MNEFEDLHWETRTYREKSSDRGYEIVTSPEVRLRAVQAGFAENEVDRLLKRLALNIRFSGIPRERRIKGTEQEQTGEILLDELSSFLYRIETKWVDTYRSLQEASLLLEVALPVLAHEQEFKHAFKRYLDLLQKNNPNGSWSFSGRILGIHFDEYQKYMDPPVADALRERLRKGYPLGMLPSIPLKEWTEAERQRFGLDTALEVDNVELVCAPVREESLGGSLEVWTSSACSYAENYFQSSIPSKRLNILMASGNPIGFQKIIGEGTFLALKTVVHNGRALLLKGGIYNVTGIPLDEDTPEIDDEQIDTNTFRTLSFVPIRIWKEERRDDSSNEPLERITLASIEEEILQRLKH